MLSCAATATSTNMSGVEFCILCALCVGKYFMERFGEFEMMQNLLKLLLFLLTYNYIETTKDLSSNLQKYSYHLPCQ